MGVIFAYNQFEDPDIIGAVNMWTTSTLFCWTTLMILIGAQTTLSLLTEPPFAH